MSARVVSGGQISNVSASQNPQDLRTLTLQTFRQLSQEVCKDVVDRISSMLLQKSGSFGKAIPPDEAKTFLENKLPKNIVDANSTEISAVSNISKFAVATLKKTGQVSVVHLIQDVYGVTDISDSNLIRSLSYFYLKKIPSISPDLIKALSSAELK